ncbi:LysR family transcriptional regulator [bacterium (Candidatus Blackallbacteria) CG17_big_fil_post_rev_8_21_14_2_50_48_46]|uniref:LysR family transcriptional regulator n=1 Tax=bacterium (Candidatus Blackallbacteria) CG17_big_fil_post_rev_8_21_14_2_50_48_46 TaxID=2014261 RepID=A0A2M7G486_9BACT|nr:MAG: LysR family transcriptional regulator [bacterium (Candidatus Blackallbacteria) CG18_big_fil_WC_8_21_14_2_50_49_26]PIW16696.1 MAG: LysR family transcriptional regulator [bacterium (Candidatus Blackallbacteria) CG17_big_fil_post_rev_8_21_14_2_50_48_46]PIW46202.1 MAG: LysR family transcriptional regulator [bacterium (Candidatus Blackallbacteria) CG13_big_fil_rev_8_21_14_2_50_49_14]
MDRIEAMKIFLRVSELQSFSQAAESLHLPKATVSTSIQKLERHLKIRLLERTTRQVQLTPEGLLFYERAQDVLADLEDIEAMFEAEARQIKGKIRIDMTVALARNLVIPLLPEFCKMHPEIEIELSSTDRYLDLIREGLDCVIRVGRGQEPGLLSKPLGEMHLINCASPEYLRKNGMPQTLEDLKTHQLIFYAMQLGSPPEGFEYFEGEKYHEIKMKGLLTVNNTIAYETACLAGLGIIQCPSAGIQAHLASGRLIEILPEFKAQPLPLKLVYPYRRRQTRRLKVFIAWLEPLIKTYLEDQHAAT